VAVCTYNALYAWEPASGRVITLTTALDNPDAPTERRAAAWSADGRRLAGWGARLAVWDSRTPAAPAQLFDAAPEAGSAVIFAFWLPDDALLAGWSGPAAQGLRVVRWEEGAQAVAPVALLPDVEAHIGVEAIYAPAPQGGEPRLLLWSGDGLLALYGADGQQVAALPAAAAINGVALAPDGRGLLVYDAGGSAALYGDDLAPALRLDAAGNFDADVLVGAHWLDNKTLLLIDRSGLLQVVSMDGEWTDFTTAPLARLQDGERLAAASRVAGGRLLTAGYALAGAASLRLWQAEPVLAQPAAGSPALPPSTAPLCTRLQRALPLPAGITWPQAVAWRAAAAGDAGDRLLITHDGGAGQWTLGGDVASLPLGAGGELAFAPDGARVLRYGTDDGGQLWRWTGEDWLQEGVVAGAIWQARWTDHGLLVGFDVAGSTLIAPGQLLALREGQVELWAIGGQQPLAAWPAPAGRSLHLADASADGQLLVYQDWQLGQLYVLRADAVAGTLALIWRSEEAHVNPGPPQLSPLLPLLATINDGVLAVVDLDGGQSLWTSKSAAAAAGQLFRKVQWSTDGQYLITQAQLPLTTRLEDIAGVWRWDAAQGALVLLQEMRVANVAGVSPDMQWLLASEPWPASIGRVAAYPLLLDSAQLRQDVQASCLLHRSLSDAERQAFLIEGR
jgi:hypothetical protein